MPVREHAVSYRNGPQVMVSGLKLRELGYGRGAEVIVTDPSGNPANGTWRFVVANDEHATLVSRNPKPPAWIQPGVVIRIEVRGASRAEPAPEGTPPSPKTIEPRVVTARELSEWRSSLIRVLNAIEGTKQSAATEGLAGRIGRLSRAGLIPRDVAAFMRTVTEMRNRTEYEEKVLTPTESEAVSAAWRAVAEWAERQDRKR